jgi:hypothetical protein
MVLLQFQLNNDPCPGATVRDRRLPALIDSGFCPKMTKD